MSRPNVLHSVLLAATCASAALTPGPVRAQVVVGRVTDAATSAALDGAEVILLDHDRAVVARTLTNSRGLYSVRLSQASTLLLTVTRIGYASADTLSIIVPPDNSAHLDLALQPRGIELPGLVVVSARLSTTLARHGFYERRRRGWGEFLDAEEIHKNRGRRLPDLLRQVPGVVVWGDVPYVVRAVALTFSTSGGSRGCPPGLVVDGMVMPDDLGFDVIPTEWIEGIEVYKQTAGMPIQWAPYGACGLIIAWTH